MARSTRQLPLTGRPIPKEPAWIMQESFLLEAGANSLRTEKTYRSGLRTFADWLQHFGRVGFSIEDQWPLQPNALDTAIILRYRNWLIDNRSRSTVTTYIAALVGYLYFLDGQDILPEGIQLGKLQRQMSRRKVERNQAETVIDLDGPRKDIPRIVRYYEQLPLPAENDAYNRRLTLLRNRAFVHVLYSTAARISEAVALSRSNVDDGRANFATIMGKGNKARTLHIRDYAQESIRAYLRERKDMSRALFVAHSRNRLNARLSMTAAHLVIKKAVKALNLHGSLSAHDFRHFRATQLLREGMPIEVVQEFLGHSDISTTRSIYAPVLGVHIVGEWLDSMDIPPDDAAKKRESETSS